MTRVNGNVICYGQVNRGDHAQEHYESASGHARHRASELRSAGYHVVTCALGPQITGVGMLRLTMLDISPGRNADTFDLPVVHVERLG